MKKTFKKIVDSVMMVASLSTSMIQMNTSAYYTSRSFGSGATAYNATSINRAYATTDTTLSNTYIKVQITKLNDYDIGDDYVASGTTAYIETTAYELGINKPSSYYQEKKPITVTLTSL